MLLFVSLFSGLFIFQSRLIAFAEELSPFSIALQQGEIKSILIIGDSISDGNGASGWFLDQEKRRENGLPKIFENQDGEVYYSSPVNCTSWVYYFQEFLNKTFADRAPKILNFAIGGKSSKWGNENKEYWVTENYDAVFIMLGTNDRWECDSIEEFEKNYRELCLYINSKTNHLVVITPPPAIPSYSKQNQFQLSTLEINTAITRICSQEGYECINMYQRLTSYSLESQISLDEFYWGGTHPNDYGYLTIWRLLAQSLNLPLPLEQVYMGKKTVAAVYDLGVNTSGINNDTAIDALAPEGKDIYPVGVSFFGFTERLGFSTEYGGTVVIYRTENNEGSKQIFKPRYKNNDYLRIFSKGIWGEWQPTNVIKDGMLNRVINSVIAKPPATKESSTTLFFAFGILVGVVSALWMILIAYIIRKRTKKG